MIDICKSDIGCDYTSVVKVWEDKILMVVLGNNALKIYLAIYKWWYLEIMSQKYAWNGLIEIVYNKRINVFALFSIKKIFKISPSYFIMFIIEI